MHDLTFERETIFPEFHHVVEALEAIATSERFALTAIEKNSVNSHGEKNHVVTIQESLGMLDRDLFDLPRTGRA